LKANDTRRNFSEKNNLLKRKKISKPSPVKNKYFNRLLNDVGNMGEIIIERKYPKINANSTEFNIIIFLKARRKILFK